MKNTSRLPHLLETPILRDIPLDQRMDFIESCALKTYARHSVLLRQGEPNDSLYLVANGRVEVSYVNEAGHNTIIGHAQAGRVLGVVEALSGRPCAGTCKALRPTSVLICRRAKLLEMMQLPAFIRNYAADIHDVLLHDNRYKSVDQFFSAEQKICTYLEKLSDADSVFRENQGYLAEVAGCSRQTVNKELGRLRDHGIIAISKEGIAIQDHDALSHRLLELEGKRVR